MKVIFQKPINNVMTGYALISNLINENVFSGILTLRMSHDIEEAFLSLMYEAKSQLSSFFMSNCYGNTEVKELLSL